MTKPAYLSARNLFRGVALILRFHTTHGNRCCPTGDNETHRLHSLHGCGWIGERKSAHTIACLRKTRRRDNTRSSFQRWPGTWPCQGLKPESGGHCIGDFPTWHRLVSVQAHAWNPKHRGEIGEKGREVSFQGWAGLDFGGICHLQRRRCPHFYTCTHKANCWPDVREVKDKRILLPPVSQIRTTQADCDRR